MNSIITENIDPNYSYEVDENGNASLIQVSTDYTPTDSQREFTEVLSKIINDPAKTTINIESNSESIFIGDVKAQAIDIEDIAAVGNGEMVSSGSTLIHELYEQYNVQVNNTSPKRAHMLASMIECDVTGYFPDPENRFANYDATEQRMYIPIYNSYENYAKTNGLATGVRIVGKVCIYGVRNNIVNVERIKF